MKKVTFIIVALFLSGCAATQGQGGLFGPGEFTITQADNRFEESKNITYYSSNNRISTKSVAGGTHIDGKGVFLNPVAVRSSDNSSLISILFDIYNMTQFDTAYGGPNRLGILSKVSFVVDGQSPIVKEVEGPNSDWADVPYYNSVSRSASSEIIESGAIFLTKSEYEKIMNASSLAVKVSGSERSVIYEPSDITPDFMANLKTFYVAHIK